MMKQGQPLDLCRLRQLHRDDIARMAPILLDRDGISQGVHCVEDQQISVPVKLDKRVGFVEAGIFVLAVSRVDDRLATPGKAVAIRIPGVKLLYRVHRKTGYLISAAGFESDELNGRGQRAKIDRKKRLRLLGMQHLTQGAVASVDANAVTGDVSRAKKRESHDVVPVRV